MENHPYTIDAIVLLPDHLHCLWTLPEGDHDFSGRWRLIKGSFSRQCDPQYKGDVSASRKTKKEQAVWQRRFWEHRIWDKQDYANHVAYIHYNPVKHGLVSAPGEWLYSSFHSHVDQGLCDPNWGAGTEMFFADGVGSE